MLRRFFLDRWPGPLPRQFPRCKRISPNSPLNVEKTLIPLMEKKICVFQRESASRFNLGRCLLYTWARLCGSLQQRRGLSQEFVVFVVSAVTVEEIDDLRILFSIDISQLDMLN